MEELVKYENDCKASYVAQGQSNVVLTPAKTWNKQTGAPAAMSSDRTAPAGTSSSCPATSPGASDARSSRPSVRQKRPGEATSGSDFEKRARTSDGEGDVGWVHELVHPLSRKSIQNCARAQRSTSCEHVDVPGQDAQVRP